MGLCHRSAQPHVGIIQTLTVSDMDFGIFVSHGER